MSVNYTEFMERVHEALQPISYEEAERAAVATLSTLSELISPEAARNLADHLPTELVDRLEYKTPNNPEELAEGLSLEDFNEIVAEKEGAGVAQDPILQSATLPGRFSGENSFDSFGVYWMREAIALSIIALHLAENP